LRSPREAGPVALHISPQDHEIRLDPIRQRAAQVSLFQMRQLLCRDRREVDDIRQPHAVIPEVLPVGDETLLPRLQEIGRERPD
jgi:hypothetical protein